MALLLSGQILLLLTVASSGDSWPEYSVQRPTSINSSAATTSITYRTTTAENDVVMLSGDIGPGVPRNVSVSVELSGNKSELMISTGPTNKDLMTNKRLKLVIRWMHPNVHQGVKLPEGYNVEVRTGSTSSASEQHTKDIDGFTVTSPLTCSEHFIDFFHHVDYNEPTELEIGSGTAKGDNHLVQFGCSYIISIQSSPVAHPPRPQIVNITVPDCVEGVCRCDIRSSLARPVSVKSEVIRAGGQNDGHDDGIRTYRISWSYPLTLSLPNNGDDEEDRRASAIVLRLEKATNIMGVGPVFRKVKEFHYVINYKVNSEDQHFEQVISQVDSRSTYRIRIAARDIHHCEGQTADIYLNQAELLSSSDAKPALHKETILVVVLLVTIFLIATASVIALSWRRFLRRLHLMTASATGSHQSNHAYPSRYSSRSPQFLQHRDNRRGTTMMWTSSSSNISTCQNLINVMQQRTEMEEPRLHLLGSKLPSTDDYEIDPCQLKLGAEIGKGAFGRVHLATVENLPGLPGPALVAVKQMKKRVGVDERDDFLAEIAMMKRVGRHENIVVMLACITLNQPYSMILEYVPYGDLLQYLRTLRSVYHQSKGIAVNDGKLISKSQQQQVLTESSVGSSVGGAGSSSAAQLLPGNTSSRARQQANTTTSDSSGRSNYHLSQIFSSVSSHSTNSSLSSASYVIPNYYRGFLKAFPTSRTIDTEELHDFARQIARGMEHLEMKGITHRDLAARNLLVSEGRVLKISDFGLSRHGVYVNTRTRMLPLRWLALESMTDNLYSSQSDVWAFGVVLWEICTLVFTWPTSFMLGIIDSSLGLMGYLTHSLGGFPYANVSDAHLMTYLMSGKRLVRPENVSEKLYQMMLKCWSANPDDRPTFHQLRISLEEFEAQHETYVDFNCPGINPLLKLPPTEEEIVT